MRTPSDKLTELLTGLQLCAPYELATCEKRVRRLCHDLPDFDSVWLDALVQQRILTPWQTEILQSPCPQRLNIGGYVLRQPLGPCSILGHDANRRNMYVFRSANQQQQRSTDNRLSNSDAPAPAQLSELVDSLAPSVSRCPTSLLLPLKVIAADDRSQSNSQTAMQHGSTATSCIISPFVPGWSMAELLIRGGRFPWPVVAEIGRELLVALSWLEAARVLHGDIVLRNVRLTPQGKIVLIDPFVRRHLQPRVLLTEELTLRDCDGIAPEMVGTGRIADVRSELYALGCLLWQLLACRSVVLTADPVSRLMKLKEQDVIDVRGPVPDCPEWMARLILSMTRRSPELRPSSIEEVLKNWRQHAGNSHSQSRALVRQLPESPVSYTPPKRRTVGHQKTAQRTVAAAAVATLLILVLAGTRFGFLPNTLRMGSPSLWLTQLRQISSVEPTGIVDNETLAAELLPDSSSADLDGSQNAASIRVLPEVNDQGQILLQAGEVYRASNRTYPALLTIASSGSSSDRSFQQRQPTILINAGSEWRLEAPAVRLQDVQLLLTMSDSSDSSAARPSDGTAESPQTTTLPSAALTMLHVISTELSIEHCVLENGGELAAGTCCYWKPMSDGASSIMLKDTILSSRGYGVRLERPVDGMSFQNTLFATHGSAIRCDFSDPDNQKLQIKLEHVSHRGGPAFADLVVRNTSISNLSLLIDGGESVLAPQQALIRIAAPESWSMGRFQADFRLPQTGNATIVPPGVEWALFFDPQLKTFVRLSDQQITAESLLIAEPVFDTLPDTIVPPVADSTAAGLSLLEGSERAYQFQLIDFEGPKLNSRMPGIDRSQLPWW